MVATGLAAPTTFAFIGGIGTLQIIILVLLLVSCSVLFMGISQELSTGRSLAVTAGLYVAMAVYALLVMG